MRKLIKTYSPFSVAIIKQNYLAYRSRFLLWTIANTVTLLVQIFLWIAIFDNSPSLIINGFSKQTMINYVILSKIIESLTFVSIEQQVASDLNRGSIVNSFTKPINYELELLFKALGSIIGSTLIFTPFYIVIYLIFNNFVLASVSLLTIFFFVVHLLITFTLNYLIGLFFASLLFKTIKHGGVYEIKKILMMFLSGALFPISFYPLFLANSLKYMPFVYIRYIPTSIILGKMDVNEMVMSSLMGLMWCMVLFIISTLFWKKMIKKITIFGG